MQVVPVVPLPPIVLSLNILCRLLTCKQPYDPPEIKYEHSNDLVFLEYLDKFISGNVSQDFYNPATAPKQIYANTPRGILEGYYMTTSNGRKIGAFEGIKYANAKRFQESIPTPGWKGIRETKKPGPECMQFHVKKLFKVYGEEDCLFLNVYTPVISVEKQSANLPVVIYVHGGSFLFGSGGDSGPAYLLNSDIVLVTFNYRLGVLGFMSTGDSELPGNLGMKDQVTAIKWVRENVKAFGGNPDDITMWGYSAGAVSVHLLMMSPMSKDLFAKGISQSATAFSSWGLHPPWRSRENTEGLAKYFRCPTKNSRKMLHCLKSVDPVSLVAAQVHLIKWMPFVPVVFVPTLEIGSENPFMDEYPEDLYRQKKVPPKPWIVSVTEHEGLSAILVLELLQRFAITKLYWKRVANIVLDLEYLHLKNEKKIIEKITRFYLGDKSTAAGTEFDYSNMVTDRYFHFPFVKAVQAHSQTAPTFAYYFSFHNGSYSIGQWNLHHPQEWGAEHGEDEYYFFNSTLFYPGFKRSDKEHNIARVMLNLVTNFIYSGAPSLKPTPDLPTQYNFTWKPVTSPELKLPELLMIDEDINMVAPDLTRIKFWQNLNLPDAKLLVPLK